MKFGFIGAGTVAQTIARHVLPFGHEVLLSNSRGPETLADIVRQPGPGASAGTPQQAADQQFVVLSVEWANVPKALAAVADWSGRTLSTLLTVSTPAIRATPAALLAKHRARSSLVTQLALRFSRLSTPSRWPGLQMHHPASRRLFCSFPAMMPTPRVH